MAPKFITVLLLCLAAQADAARKKNSMQGEDSVEDFAQEEDLQDEDEDRQEAFLEVSGEDSEEVDEESDLPRRFHPMGVQLLADMKPGTSVTWHSDKYGKYEGTVESAEMMAMVTVKYKSKNNGKMYTKLMPLDDLELVEEDDDVTDEGPSPGGGNAGDEMNIRQRIVCDVCLRKLSSCSGYKPSEGMLNPVRPPPESPNGRYYTCPPSERELWSRDDRFKVVDPSRSKCPSERRAPPVNGKLSMARRICKLGLSWSSFSSCSDVVNDKAPVFGRDAVCSASVQHLYN